jgi:hypothetical protein
MGEWEVTIYIDVPIYYDIRLNFRVKFHSVEQQSYRTSKKVKNHAWNGKQVFELKNIHFFTNSYTKLKQNVQSFTTVPTCFRVLNKPSSGGTECVPPEDAFSVPQPHRMRRCRNCNTRTRAVWEIIPIDSENCVKPIWKLCAQNTGF